MYLARTAGETGSLTNYNLLASELPQRVRLAVYQQEEEPEGWREGGHGPYPEGGVTVAKGRLPPNWKSWRTGVNWHPGENLHLHDLHLDLYLHPNKQQALTYTCTCTRLLHP